MSSIPAPVTKSDQSPPGPSTSHSNMDVSVESSVGSSVYYTPRTSPVRPYENVTRMFGKFFCNNCKRFWFSSNAWKHCFQLCTHCRAPVRPTKLQPLIPKRNFDTSLNTSNDSSEAISRNDSNDTIYGSATSSQVSVLDQNGVNGDPKSNPNKTRKSVPTVKYFVRHPKWLCEQCIKYGDCLKRNDSCVPKYRRKTKNDKVVGETSFPLDLNREAIASTSAPISDSPVSDKKILRKRPPKSAEKKKSVKLPEASQFPSSSTEPLSHQLSSPTVTAKPLHKVSPRRSFADSPLDSQSSPAPRTDSGFGDVTVESVEQSPEQKTKRNKSRKDKKKKSDLSVDSIGESPNTTGKSHEKKKNKIRSLNSESDSPNSAIDQQSPQPSSSTNLSFKSPAKKKSSRKNKKVLLASPSSSSDDKAFVDTFSGDSDSTPNKSDKKNNPILSKGHEGLNAEDGLDIVEAVQNLSLDSSTLEVISH